MGAINPYREFVASISPTEFEELCLEILKGYAEAEHLSDFSIQHNVSIPADDGTYQIDVYARFIAMGVEFKVIAECKRYSSPVSREKVAVLADKVKSLGAHKGIMISTCGFQSGAYEYAKKHGIALLQVINRNVMHKKDQSADWPAVGNLLSVWDIGKRPHSLLGQCNSQNVIFCRFLQ